MKEFTLPKTGGTATIDILHEADLSDVMKLHETARAALPEDRQRYILPQSASFFQNLLTRMTGMMVGIRANDILIAQMGLAGPLPLREAMAMHTITRNDVRYHHASLDDTVIVYKSLAAHPLWRDNDLEKNLVSFASSLPFTQVADHVFAQFSVGYKKAWEPFVRQKFGIVAAANDPEDGLPRFILQKPSFGFDLIPAIIADEVDPVFDFPAIISLTQREALVGIFENDASAKLSFLRNREEINLMPVLARVSKQKT